MANRNDMALLQELLEELVHRRTRSARSLMTEILAGIDDIGPQTEEHERGTQPQAEYRDHERDQTVSPSGHVANAATKRVPHHDHAAQPAHANSPRADGLDRSETEVYGNIPDDRERPDQLTLIRPLGTKGLPDEYVRPLKREIALDLSADADLPERFIVALQELIREIKKTGQGQRRYELDKGHRGEAAGGDILYHFSFTDEAELFEDAQVEVQVDGRRIEATIVSIDVGHLVLALKEDIGKDVGFAVLLIDATALLELLKGKIEAVNKGEITLNRTLADAAVRLGILPKTPDYSIRSHRSPNLNDSQHEAYKKALVEAVTFIWGPPGSGKTRTLTEIVRSAFEDEKRTLICSNTNKAVDQVLYQICNALGREHLAMEEGKIVRLGRVADDKLESDYREYVTVDGIVERLSRIWKQKNSNLR